MLTTHRRLNDYHSVLPEAKASIAGPSDLYVKTGSLVKLLCSVSQGPHDLGIINWYRGEFCVIIIIVITIPELDEKCHYGAGTQKFDIHYYVRMRIIIVFPIRWAL
jgi:hypothetical protein